MQFFNDEDLRIRRQALEDALATRVLVLDGAMGTMLQQRRLTVADFGGAALEGCNEKSGPHTPRCHCRHSPYLFRSRGRHC